MRSRSFVLAFAFVLFASAEVRAASWYDEYDEGIAAVKRGNWSTVVQKMSAAIKGNGTESNRARAYGTIFYNYHPYYYRGIAHLNLGNYEQAIADLEKTMGPGQEDLGPIATHLDRAKRQLTAAREPEPEPVRPDPVRPAPAVTAPAPALPQIDQGLRQRAVNSISAATQKVRAAQQRRADGSPQYAQAMSILTDATTKNAAAKNNDDLQSIISMAENAGVLADLAMPPTVASVPSPVTPAPVVPKTTAATTTILSDYTDEVRRALEYYFAGEFETASKHLEELSSKMPNNAWIWAFLGASQYSQYAFEADESYRRAAERSFARAKALRSWKDGLPEKYFSRRIRQAFGAG